MTQPLEMLGEDARAEPGAFYDARAEPGAFYDARAELGAFDEEPVIECLEVDQLVAQRHLPVGRAHISPGLSAALWALRVFVIVVGAMVIYTFVAHLGG